MSENLVINCETCAVRHDLVCGDCVVTFILDRAPEDAVIIDVGEARALRLLADAEMIPRLRHETSTRGA
jgi:hypothetical protein